MSPHFRRLLPRFSKCPNGTNQPSEFGDLTPCNIRERRGGGGGGGGGGVWYRN